MQFQRESTITTNEQNQNTIEEAHDYLNKIILQAAEKIIPKTSSEVNRKPLYYDGTKSVKGKKIVRAKYRKH